jgi:hypothetical protein
MYESCDGEVANSTETITALEDYRAEQSRQLRGRQLENSLRRRDEQYDKEFAQEPMTKLDKIFSGIILGLFGTGFIYYILKSNMVP